jgi:DNA-binding NarL/FixJ family response regulator
MIVINMPIIRVGLTSILESSDDIKVTGECDNGFIAVQKNADLNTDVIIVGISKPEEVGLQNITEIKRSLPDARVIALSVSASLKSLYDALKLGAANYISEGMPAQEMREVVRKTASFASAGIRS